MKVAPTDQGLPTHRCGQAAGIARQLDLPVVLVPQLADCAMGCQDGGGVAQEAGEGATGPTGVCS